jgi:hypothetical protein
MSNAMRRGVLHDIVRLYRCRIRQFLTFLKFQGVWPRLLATLAWQHNDTTKRQSGVQVDNTSFSPRKIVGI